MSLSIQLPGSRCRIMRASNVPSAEDYVAVMINNPFYKTYITDMVELLVSEDKFMENYQNELTGNLEIVTSIRDVHPTMKMMSKEAIMMVVHMKLLSVITTMLAATDFGVEDSSKVENAFSTYYVYSDMFSQSVRDCPIAVFNGDTQVYEHEKNNNAFKSVCCTVNIFNHDYMIMPVIRIADNIMTKFSIADAS
jgi:hypothetical protein